ncbi:MAG TPA: class I SAM-dependent methyltransferase [Chitinophagales bacterium]|nr:class I SAM-dependent methyltransferase [Chitinophagales bacterium]
MAGFWDERYSADEYVYGTAPNEYFKSIIDGLKPGRLLVPGAGEGRDAVYAATKGWQVLGYDASAQGREKAMRLAKKQNVLIDYVVTDAKDFIPEAGVFDAVAMIYFHLPLPLKEKVYADADVALKTGGTVIMEVFNPKQLQNESGGPKDIAMLATTGSLQSAFSNFEILQNQEAEIMLHEGKFHEGKADVIRFCARKK